MLQNCLEGWAIVCPITRLPFGVLLYYAKRQSTDILSSIPGSLGQRLKAIIFVIEDHETDSSLPRSWTIRAPSNEQLSQFFNHPQTSYYPPTTHVSVMQNLGAVPLSGSQQMDVEAWKDYPRPWTDKSQPQRFSSGTATAPGEHEAPRRDGRGICKVFSPYRCDEATY